jgi:hypothetical protein
MLLVSHFKCIEQIDSLFCSWKNSELRSTLIERESLRVLGDMPRSMVISLFQNLLVF